MQKEQTTITVHVQPNSSQNKITGFRGGVLKVRIAAPPVEGKANKELIEFLSELLDIKKSNLVIIRGTTGRIKTIAISGLTRNAVLKELDKYQSE